MTQREMGVARSSRRRSGAVAGVFALVVSTSGMVVAAGHAGAVPAPAVVPSVVSDSAALVAAVNAGGTVTVAPGTYTLATALTITKPNTALLAATPGTVTLRTSSTNGRVVEVKATGARIDGIRITGGTLATANGAGILVNRNTSLELTRSTVTGNSAREGGGIANLGTLVVRQSTIDANTAQRKGGGLLNTGTATVENSTFVGNVADQGGAVSSPGTTDIVHATIVRNQSTSSSSAGVDRNGGVLRVHYSIIGSNTRTNGSAASDCSGTPDLLGLNLVSDSSGCNPVGQVKVAAPGVGPLADNGGPTLTAALLDSSAALDARLTSGACSASTATVDQRGTARPNGPCRDLGAFERAPLAVDLSLTTDTSNYADHPAGTVEVGLVSVPVGDIVGELASSSGSIADTALRSIALRSIALRSITLEDIALRSIEPKAAALRSIALRSIALRSIALRSIALRSIALRSIALRSIPLSEIPLTEPGGWAALLATTSFADVPLQSITLEQLQSAGVDLDGLTLESIDLSNTALRSIALRSIVLADVALRSIPVDGYTPGADGSYAQAWCDLLGDLCGSGDDQLTATEIGDADLLSLQLAGGDVDGVDISAVPLTGLAQTLESTALRSIALRSIALRSIYLENTALRSIALRSIALRSIALRSIDGYGTYPGIIDCGGTPDFCSTDASNQLTLADAIAAGRLSATATIGDLVALVCQPGETACLDLFAGFSLADLVLAFVAPDVAPWEEVNLDGSLLQNVGEPPQPTFDYVATVTVTDAVANLDLRVTLPPGFAVAARPGETATFDGAALNRDQSEGLGVAAFTISGVTPGIHELRVPVRAGLETGTGFTALAEVVASAPGQQNDTATATTSVNVVAATEGDGGPNATASLDFGELRLAHISSGDDVDLYRFVAPEWADGATARVLLSNIPESVDYDLAIYSPATPSLRGTPDRTLGSLGDVRYDLDPTDDALPTDIVDDIALDAPESFGILGYALRDVSTRRSNDDEEVVLTAIEKGRTYYVAVTSYLDDSNNRPYGLRLRVDETDRLPACREGDRTFSNPLPAPGTSTIPAGVNTLYVTNTQWLAGENGAASAGAVLTAAGRTGEVAGVVPGVLAVDSDPTVRQKYAEWAQGANRCDPEARNAVVRAIGSLLDSVLAANPGITNLVILGGDGVVPMAAVPDMTAYSNESTFARDVLTNGRSNELAGALGAGYLLSDDPYGTARGIAIQGSGHELYVPELNLGRVVETGPEIFAQLDNFRLAGGRLDPATAALVTGYDFLSDGADDVADTLAGGVGDVDLLNDDSWARQTYLDLFVGGGADLLSPNAHYDFESLLPAKADAAGTFSRSDLVLTEDFTGANASRLPLKSLVFTMGCHAGLSVADVQLGFAALDWAQLYGSGDNPFLGHTTFGYGDTEIAAFSERLATVFAERVRDLLTGADGAPRSMGEALREAKQEYLATTLVLTPYDEKILQSFTYYGLPMYTTAGDLPPTPPAPSPVTFGAPVTETRTGLAVRPVSVDLAITVGTSGPANLNRVSTPQGSYYEVGGDTVMAQYRPVQPLVQAPIPGAGAAGFLITGLTSFDEEPFEALHVRPTIDLDAHERPIVAADTSFPARLQDVTADANGAQRLLVAAGQFESSTTPGIGRQRLFTSVRGQLYSATAGSDGVGPRFVRVDGSVGQDEDVVFFEVETDTSARRVVVTYRIDNDSTWRSLDLFRPQAAPLWIGGIPVPDNAIVEFFVQAVDADGDVSISDNKVRNFFSTAPAVDGDLQIVVNATGSQVGGYFDGDVLVEITNNTGATEYSVDGGAFQPYTGPFVVSGDGGHVIFARDESGSQLRYLVIDGSAPTLSALRTPATYWSAGSVNVVLTAVDTGQSGVASITYEASGATTFASTTVPGAAASLTVSAEGLTTVTAYATDGAGNQSAPVSVEIRIDITGPTLTAFVSPVPAPGANGFVKGPVSVAFSASDTGSGVASISTTIGTTTTAYTGPVSVTADGTTVVTGRAVDNVGNPSAPLPVTVNVDARPPTASVTVNGSDADGDGLLEASSATFACADPAPGSGIASCVLSLDGQVVATAPGGTSSTFVLPSTLSLGTHTLSVAAADNVGNIGAAASTTFRTGYRVCLMYDPAQAKTIGSNYTIKLRLCDANGTNLSSSSITLTALTVDGTIDPGPNDSGKANAGYTFRYQASDRSYIYNLNTDRLPAGNHRLYFTTEPVPSRAGLPASPLPTNAAPFALRA